MNMISLFTKSIELLTGEDVLTVLGWPESLTVDFKKDLWTKDHKPSAWATGGSLEDRARDKILKEVIAFANTSGGHLVLGVDETKEAPPAAAAITPIPRCVDLAERLARAAQGIDPPIPLLLVQGIPTDGDAGVVVFRVPASRSAPHRGLDKECYVRRGTSSVPVGMREIQDMTLAGGRRDERVDARFTRAAATFAAWFALPLEEAPHHVGFRITAVPVGAQFELGRLYGHTAWTNLKQDYTIAINGRKHQAHAVYLPRREIPIVRGVRLSYDESSGRNYFDIHSDGVIELGFKIYPANGACALALAWIVAYVVNVLRAVDVLRNKAELADCEYGIELELRGSLGNTPIDLKNWPGGWEDNVGYGLRRLPLTLPRLSFGPISELNNVVSLIVNDLFDAAAARHIQPIALQVS